MLPKQYELHQACYMGPYYITTAEEFAQKAIIMSSDRVVAAGTFEAMLAAQELCRQGPPLWDFCLLDALMDQVRARIR